MKGFHLTKTNQLYEKDGIIEKGLVPTVGDRSKSVDEAKPAVYFTSSYFNLPAWWLYLYPSVEPQELCVLTFDIPDDWCINKQGNEFCTYNIIPPEAISVVSFFNGITNEEVPFIYLQKDSLYYGDEWGSKPVPLTYTLEETPILSLERQNLH